MNRVLLIVSGFIAAYWVVLAAINFGSINVVGTKSDAPSNAKAIVRMSRIGEHVRFSIYYFPTFRSELLVRSTQSANTGVINIEISSAPCILMCNKSEQLTDASFNWPATSVKPGQLVIFRSLDYDETVVSEYAP